MGVTRELQTAEGRGAGRQTGRHTETQRGTEQVKKSDDIIVRPQAHNNEDTESGRNGRAGARWGGMGEGGEERSTKVSNFSGSHCGRLFVCKAYTHKVSNLRERRVKALVRS